MKQIRQFLKDGTLEMTEVPVPAPGAGDLLVRTHFSFVSVGTEKMKVTQARMNLAEKAAERPDQVRQVLDTVREQGLMPTVRKVQERLKAPATLGYSCAGTVVDVGDRAAGFRVGDRVACIGEGVATHAEFNVIPANLAVHVPNDVGLDLASSAAVGAIALQGIRQARLELGETVAVIGLGLLGQFLVQLCRANGCPVLGVDPDAAKRELALANGAQAALPPDADDVLAHALRMSQGLGVDAVVVTTAVKDNGPIEMAAHLVRDRGRVVGLGNTHIELDWRTWFGKEIEFLFSRAMGAGMTDPDYLTRGRDYPAGHVRWTANRNVAAYLDLIAAGGIQPGRLITHRFPFEQAPTVFDRMARGDLASAVGIVFEYPDGDAAPTSAALRTVRFARGGAAGAVRLGVIGAGNYAKSMILPHLPGLSNVSLAGVCTAHGANAEALAKRYGFRFATTDAAQIVTDPDCNAVMIATRHDSHSRLAAAALSAGKHAYVEKPLAMNAEQLAPVIAALQAHAVDGPTLWLGHNRRYAPLSQRLVRHFEGVGVRQVTLTIRSAGIPADSWYQEPTEGGGVLFGDVCHFLDLAAYFAGSLPTELHAFATPDPAHREEGWAIHIRFANGGLASIHYTCGSQDGQEREVFEVLGGGRAARLSGFRRLVLRHGRRRRQIVQVQPDLGQQAMLGRMTAQFRRDAGVGDETESFVVAAQLLLAAQRSVVSGRAVTFEPRFPFAFA